MKIVNTILADCNDFLATVESENLNDAVIWAPVRDMFQESIDVVEIASEDKALGQPPSHDAIAISAAILTLAGAILRAAIED